ncbi:Transcription factor HEX [Handroanthus impetiginosus]|uniref:Homeobox-leucine zipper protein n=1 Tax=Handroanthus impetiginosus TaxID=429701 RepID=A0A2G9HQE7_9LAMI|nr:Transcription factor HEX [Handroanthus impetiginosus]
MPSSGLDRAEELQPEDDISDDYCQLLGEKKRRFNLDQVKALEKSFELVLSSREWKTKQLEKDYDVLRRQFESLKAENDALKSQNKKLQSELLALRSRESARPVITNLNKENECSWNNESTGENSCYINLSAISMDNIIYHDEGNQNAVAFASSVGPGDATLTFNSSLRPEHQLQGPAHEPFYNVFSGIEENHDFLLWPEQNFH